MLVQSSFMTFVNAHTGRGYKLVCIDDTCRGIESLIAAAHL